MANAPNTPEIRTRVDLYKQRLAQLRELRAQWRKTALLVQQIENRCEMLELKKEFVEDESCELEDKMDSVLDDLDELVDSIEEDIENMRERGDAHDADKKDADKIPLTAPIDEVEVF